MPVSQRMGRSPILKIKIILGKNREATVQGSSAAAACSALPLVFCTHRLEIVLSSRNSAKALSFFGAGEDRWRRLFRISTVFGSVYFCWEKLGDSCPGG